MGVPYFHIKELCLKNNVKAYSSNFQLYRDMSSRVMSIILENFPNVEVYSIDEAFIEFDVVDEKEAFELFSELRSNITKYTGISVSIGIAPTKTLAKVAGNFAKKDKSGLKVLFEKENIKKALVETEVGDIWG
jgi:DNA polymerase V